MLGWELAQKFFNGRDPDRPDRKHSAACPIVVIGVVGLNKATYSASRWSKFVVTPITSPARRLTNCPHILDDLQVQATNPLQMREAIDEVRERDAHPTRAQARAGPTTSISRRLKAP